MATYLAIFIFEMLVALILWFILVKIFKNKFYSVAIIICIILLVVGYIFASRYVGYNITWNYLTEINNTRIQETGEEITSEEENDYKNNLFSDVNFKNMVFLYSLKLMAVPSILSIVIMLSIAIKSQKMLLKSG